MLCKVCNIWAEFREIKLSHDYHTGNVIKHFCRNHSDWLQSKGVSLDQINKGARLVKKSGAGDDPIEQQQQQQQAMRAWLTAPQERARAIVAASQQPPQPIPGTGKAVQGLSVLAVKLGWGKPTAFGLLCSEHFD